MKRGFFVSDRCVLVVLSLVALAFLGSIVWSQRDRTFRGVNDFIPLYSGAWLLERGGLYDNELLQEVSREKTGMWSHEHGYIRLPFHAAFVWPLSRLSYPQAYAVWQALSLAAICGFVVLWRQPAWPVRVLFAALSIPLLHAWLKGQDVPFVLFAIALSMHFHMKGRSKLAGFVFSLCAAKFHLFLLTPVLIVGQRYWNFGAGLLMGGALLAGVSFAVAGPAWPLEFLAEATNPTFSPGVSAMPNLHGALSELPWDVALEALLTMTVILAVWVAARRASWEYAFACSLAGGLLLSHHSYLLDSAVLLPAGLTVLACSQRRGLKGVAILLLCPVAHFLIAIAYPYSAVMTGVILALVYGMAVEAWQGVGKVAEPVVAAVRDFSVSWAEGKGSVAEEG